MTYGFENLSQTQTLEKLFEQYKKEMLYLRNFSEKTLQIYQEVFNRWQKYVGEMPTEKNLSLFVIGMREAGLNTTSCNISIRGFNSFLTWMKDNGHCQQTFSNGKPFKLAKLPEEKKTLRVFDDADIHKILSFKPKGRNAHRIYASRLHSH